MNFNQPAMTCIIVCVWLVSQRPTQLVLFSVSSEYFSDCETGRREEVGLVFENVYLSLSRAE